MSIERTKQTNEFVHSLKELGINLKNTNIKTILEKKEFDVVPLLRSIKILSANLNLISDDLLLKLHQKTKELIQHTNYADFTPYFNVFLNPANYLIEYAEEISHSSLHDEDLNIDSLDNHSTLISEEEFSKRYDLLITKLTIFPASSNLVLETPSEKRPFKAYKNSANTIVIYAGQEATPMSLTKEALIDHVYKGLPHRLIYARVIADKILDNTIFKFLSDKNSTIDLTEALKNQINKQENDLIILRDKLETLEKESEQFSTTKEQILQLQSTAKNAQKEYEDAKQAAINQTKLNASVSYWAEKQKRHNLRFKSYGALAIGLIAILIIGLSLIISNHNFDSSATKTNDNHTPTLVEINTSKEKNATRTVTLKTNNQDNNQTAKKLSLDNPIDYLHYFGWYALLIFASSSALWIIRITVKIALSNLHLSEDAHERVVMIQTYLAFINEGHGLEENDKQLIMTSLFRPSNIGIIQDESSITVADIISSLKGK